MTDDKIIEQIRQLLRIASDRGASINERELAQRRAERLMVRHRIETLPEGNARARVSAGRMVSASLDSAPRLPVGQDRRGAWYFSYRLLSRRRVRRAVGRRMPTVWSGPT